MECDADEKLDDDDNLGHSSIKNSSHPENVTSQSSSRRRKRKRPRTKAFRQTIREKIEIAICTSNSPIQEILKADKDCAVSAPLSSIIKLLKLETDEYRKLSCKALISIGVLSKFFSISGNSRDNLQLVLKGNCTDQSSTIVYVDNLPNGCKVDSLGKWASTFGTVVFVHPIVEKQLNRNKGSTTSDESTLAEVSTSTAFNGKFFRSAFIKFVDVQSPVDFIKFHQLLRKKAGGRRRKKLRLERKKARKKNSVATIRSKIKPKRKRRKRKRNTKKSAVTQFQKAKSGEEAMETKIIHAEKSSLIVDNFNDVVKGEASNHSGHRRRKKPNLEVNDVKAKRFKTTSDEEKKAETENVKPNGLQNTGSNEVVDIDAVEGSQGNVDVKMEVDDQLTAVTTAQQLTVEVTDDSSRKTFRDVGTDAPEDLLSKVEGATKKRKRVHRQKRRDDKPTNCILHPKKYFHEIQAYSFGAFQKLRARYLELQKQQMVQLKASLKKKSVPLTLPGMTKKERRKKRGRCRLMMRAAKLHEEYVDLCCRIPEEDKLADVQIQETL